MGTITKFRRRSKRREFLDIIKMEKDRKRIEAMVAADPVMQANLELWRSRRDEETELTVLNCTPDLWNSLGGDYEKDIKDPNWNYEL